jgi:hypothetical protein
MIARKGETTMKMSDYDRMLINQEAALWIATL